MKARAVNKDNSFTTFRTGRESSSPSPAERLFLRGYLVPSLIAIGVVFAAGAWLSMFGNDYLHVFSANISVCTLFITAMMLIRWRDWRVVPLALLFLTLSVQQTLALAVELGYAPETRLTEWILNYPFFVPIVLGFAVVISMWRLFEAKAAIENKERELAEHLEHGQKLESLGVMAGGVAHKFNNLLTTIIGNVALAEMDAKPGSELANSLKQINAAAEQAARISHQMLDYSGHGKFEVRPVDVASMITEMSELLGSCLSRGCQIAYDIAPGRQVVVGDASQLGQIAINLVTNASDALGDSGMVTLRVQSRKADAADLMDCVCNANLQGRECVVLSVIDNGCGIADKMKANVFDPFVSTKSVGRGMGLAAVLGIVRGHYGTIRLRSRVNEGTQVDVFLPAATAEEQQTDLATGLQPAVVDHGDGSPPALTAEFRESEA